ncbi:MAG TPA: trigger factor [Clostridia bacterium]|nr:trigger factor [Clostridia bacterium]
MTSTETKNENVSACTREVSIEIPADVVTRQTESVISKYQKMARIPGFRRGKTPATIIRQKFMEDIRTEVAETLIPKYFKEEAEKQSLVPVSQPRVTDLHIHDGEPLRFKATFEVMPEIEVSGYQELRPEPVVVTVTDEEVGQTLENIRQQHATYTNVEEDRPLQDGDFAQASFKGSAKTDGESPAEGENKPVEMDEVLVEIGGSNTIAEFSENLRGAKAGEERNFEVTYPQDFSDQRLSGKTFQYQVKIKGIKQKSVPELNDEFVKELGGEFTTLDELKAKIREGMQQEKEHQAEHQAKDKIVEDLVNKYQFDVPDSLVEQQIDVRLDRGLRALAAQGMKTEDLKKLDFARLRDGQREAAKREVKASLLLEKIADSEKIEVSDDELAREIEGIARQMNQTPEAIRARLTQDGAVDRIRDRIRNEKALEFLYRRSA